MSKRSERALTCLIPGGITLIIILIALATKGMWPFGDSRLDYFDNMQQVAPLYSHLWDWMHGDADLFFDKYSGMGTSVTMSISAFSMLSPFNVILYFVPRDMILESFAVFIMVKCVCASVCMYIFLRYMFGNMSVRLKTTFSVCYSLCGFVVMYAPAFMPWMDVVALFPLAAMGLFKILNERKKALYIIMTAIIFIINYYMGAMIIVYFLLISGCFIIFNVKSGERLKRAWDLIVGTVTGLGLSAVIVLPVFSQLSHSQRNAENPGLIGQYKDIITDCITRDSSLSALQRFLMLFGISFVVAIAISGLIKGWNLKKKGTMFYTCVFVIGLLPVGVQGVNTVWHFGSYYGYTLRMGYITAFSVILTAAGLLYADVGKSSKREPAKPWEHVVGWIVGIGSVVAYIIVYRFIPKHWELYALIIFMSGFGALVTFYLIRINIHGNKKYSKVDVAPFMPVIFAEIFIALYSFIGLPTFYNSAPFQYGDYVEAASEVKEGLNIQDSATDRISNPDVSLNGNYPLVMRRGALSSFTAALSDGSKQESIRWGHSGYFLWMLDSGGTPFSDALFHVTQYVSRDGVDDTLATPVSSNGEYTLYDSKYVMPFAVSIDNASYEELKRETKKIKVDRPMTGNEIFDGPETDETYEWIGMHNAYYHAITGSDEMIANPVEITDIEDEIKSPFVNSVYFKANVKGKNQALYICLKDKDYDGSDISRTKINCDMRIFINGREVTVSTIGYKDNKWAISDFNNNLIYLGTFDESVCDIRIQFIGLDARKNIRCSMGALDLGMVDAMCRSFEGYKCDVSEDKNCITVSTESDGAGKVLLLPEIYTQDMDITVNGTGIEVAPDMGLGLFTAVPVNAGDNTVTVKWKPHGIKYGLIISGIFLAAFVIIWAIKRSRILTPPKWILWASGVLYFAVFGGVCIFMIVIPVIFAIPAIFM